MPVDWANKWQQFYKDISSYQREGKNKHDDAPDALTGIAEMLTKNDVGYSWNL